MGLLRSGAYEPPAAGVSAPDLSGSPLTERDSDKAPTAVGQQSRSEPRSVSGLVDPSIPPGPLNLVGLEPRVRAAASPTSRRNRPGASLPDSRAVQPRAYLAALERCRRAWARTQMQLELEVWPC
jgi:hypothetical protein